MRPLTLIAILVAGAASALTGPAGAVAIAGPAGSPGQSQAAVKAAPAPAVDAGALALASGQIDAIDLQKAQVVIAGRAVPFDPRGLRVIGPNGDAQTGPASLRKGMRVRFALEPGPDDAARRIVLVYIERQP